MKIDELRELRYKDRDKYEELMRKEREESERLEKEYFAENYPDIFKEEYPTEPIDTYYWDQAPYNCQYYGYRLSSVYLPHGIKQMDHWFSKQILSGCPAHTPEHMEKMIRCNPHLHNVIKTNLINNLKNMRGL